MSEDQPASVADANLEVARGLFGAFDRGALEQAAALLDPDIEWDNAVLLDEGVIHGRHAVLEYWERILSTFPFLHEEHRYEVRGARVAVLARLRARGASSGATLDQQVGYVMNVRDGMILKARLFADQGRALDAMKRGHEAVRAGL